jgi:hypothetical protein
MAGDVHFNGGTMTTEQINKAAVLIVAAAERSGLLERAAEAISNNVDPLNDLIAAFDDCCVKQSWAE